MKFMEPNVAEYYPNALCFEDLSDISFLGNWFDSRYNSLMISIDACRNSYLEPDKCKSPEEISKWMGKQIFYVVSQKTSVDKSIYSWNANNDFNDENGNYFPLHKSPSSLLYEAPTTATNHKEIVPVIELMLGMDELELDDGQLSMNMAKRTKQFINVKSTRKISDKKSRYARKGSDP